MVPSLPREEVAEDRHLDFFLLVRQRLNHLRLMEAHISPGNTDAADGAHFPWEYEHNTNIHITRSRHLYQHNIYQLCSYFLQHLLQPSYRRTVCDCTSMSHYSVPA